MGYIPRSQLVYHAGLMPVPHPDITLSSSRTDFGKGFYVTHNIDQAYNWGMKKVMKEIEYATMQKTVPFTKEFVVSQYVMLSQKGIEKCGFKTKAFSEPGPEWAEMIFNCRVRKDRPPFDIITGPVADDDINGILNMIEDVMLSLEQETSVKTTDDILRDRFIKAAKWFRPKREFEQVALTNNDVI